MHNDRRLKTSFSYIWSPVHGLRLVAVMRAGTGPAPTSDGAKLRKVSESAKKSGEKFGGNGKNAYLCSVKHQV